MPTMLEAGIPDFFATSWIGLFAPAQTSPEIVRRLAKEASAVGATPQFDSLLAKFGARKNIILTEDFRRVDGADGTLWPWQHSH